MSTDFQNPRASARGAVKCIRIPGGLMCVQPDFKPGDQAPEGYLAWHEWADKQHKAGLRQKECGRCRRWKYPQELSATQDAFEAKSRKGLVNFKTPVCHTCAAHAESAVR